MTKYFHFDIEQIKDRELNFVLQERSKYMIKVYIKVNEQHEITEVGSSIFIDDLTGWTYLDEGTGDKYAHAQNNYFDKPVVNEDGSYNYLFINGKVYER